MWSPHYFYFYLCSDKRLSGEAGIEELNRFLDGLPQLNRKSRWQYSNSERFPWIDITLLHAANYDNWAFDESKKYSSINLIPVVGSKRLEAGESLEQRHEQYLSVLAAIAKHFGWKLIEDEENDEEVMHVT